MHDLSSRMHDLGSCRLSESVLCRMQVAMSQCLKVARHGLKVAQRVRRVLCPYLRAGFCQALRFHSAEASELNSGERCFPERERSERCPSRRHLLPKLLSLILLVLWGYDTVPSVSTAPYAPATATVPSLSTAPDAPATATVPSVSTAPDAPATSPAPLWLPCQALARVWGLRQWRCHKSRMMLQDREKEGS